MSTLQTLPSKSKTLLQTLYSDDNGVPDDSVIVAHVTGASLPAIEFPENAEWVNSGPLTIHGNLKGRYILLDFFTYCCINCMHILPALHQLEEDVPEGLVVVGVHSGKFSNEKSNDNIRNAVTRYKITHPVINDQHYEMWGSYSIVCWPTLVLINPAGKVVLVAIGESDVEKVVRFVKDAVRVSPPSGIQPVSLLPHTSGQQDCGPKKILSYPGKVYYHTDSNTVFIADTSNNRIVQTNTRGEVLNKYPSPESPPLDSPQGLRVYQGGLYVCDTNNHRVVRIDLETGGLEVLCGTGVQGHDLEGGGSGREQEISSPWDLEVVSLQSLPGCHGDLLMVAMAGTHQIWGHALTDITITHRGQRATHTKGRTWRLAGSGDEANKNNSYPHKAAFAQPSGISYDEGRFVYVADSESSTVRCLELPSFAVRNVAGGGLDPADLFAYGDHDGKGTAAKFQHPIGVTYTRDALIIADSYNHRIKLVETNTRAVSTVQDVTGLSEPSGLSYDRYSNRVYVADTNNHSIRVVDLGSLRSVELEVSDRMRFAGNSGVSWVGVEDAATTLTLRLSFANKLNTSGPSHVKVTPHGGVKSRGTSHEVLISDQVVQIPLTAEEVEGAGEEVERAGALELLITLYTCSDDGACFMNKYTHRINFVERTTEMLLCKENEALVIKLN